jgi:hypothetical protein
VSVVLTTEVTDRVEHLERFLAFHKDARVTAVLVADASASSAAIDVLEPYVREGFVHRLGGVSASELAQAAASELGADWVVPSTTEELWWPRAESLEDVLAVVPHRYGVVQGLVRRFVGGGTPPTVRTSLLGPAGSGGAAPRKQLRPIYRAGADMTIAEDDWTLRGSRVPLRAWYPVEVLDFSSIRTPVDVDVEAGLADGSLVSDLRVRDALLGEAATVFPVPSLVDDASHAVECAAVGEVDLVRLDRHIRDLELRIAALEARFWPRMRRAARGLIRRRSQ